VKGRKLFPSTKWGNEGGQKTDLPGGLQVQKRIYIQKRKTFPGGPLPTRGKEGVAHTAVSQNEG